MPTKSRNSSGRPTVFIGYSHQDEGWKDRFTAALKALDLRHDVEVWSDRRITAGEGWVADIAAVVSRAKVAILLISPDFLASRFIRRPEISRLLQRRQEEGLLVIPLFVRPSSWEGVDWLAGLQGRPKNANPLSKYGTVEADRILKDFVLEIRSWLTASTESPLSQERRGARRERRPGGEVPPRLRHRKELDLPEGPELAMLRLLGLFDGPAQPGAIAALRAKPAISGLTEPLMDLEEETWQWVLSNLRQLGLLLADDPRRPGFLDAGPVVRMHFQEDLKTSRPEAWKAGNLRLYEHFQKEAPDLPDTLEEMEPLYTAVIHGCRAGRQQEAFKEVYRRRIQRNSDFNIRKLGDFGSALSALFGFFNRPWDQPSAHLNSGQQTFVLNEAGLALRALGRLVEAVPPTEEGLRQYESRKEWKHAAISAINLSSLTLTLGEVTRAISLGKQSVDLADRSGVAAERMYSRTMLADALHQSGRLEESEEAFREARALPLVADREDPRAYSLLVYWYCDLLLSRGGPYREVLERAEHALRHSLGQDFIFAIALAHLSLGRAHLGLGDLSKAADHLNQAVERLRRSGREDHLPRGLLARAAWLRLRGDGAAAEADLSEALEIAERGSMRLHECDAHLEWARLCWQRGDREGREWHVARARKLVEDTGYERRRREVEWLESPPAAPVPQGHQPLGPEELLLLAFRLVATRRSSPDLLLHLDATRLREAAEGVLAIRGLDSADRLRAAASLLAEQAPDLLPDPLWQSWMLASQGKVLQDLAAAMASDLPG